MIKAIIWDMDGVIIDSETHYLKREKEFLSRLGVQSNNKILKSYMGVPFSKYFPLLAKEYGSNVTLEEAKGKYHEFIEELYTHHVELTPNTKKVFKELNKKYQFALATSTTRKLAESILSKFSILNYFKIRIYGDDIENGKPDPEIFLEAAKLLGKKNSECVIVEDSLNGMKAAKAAGMILIAFKAQHNKYVDFSLADFVIDDLGEISGILKRLNKES